MQTKTVKNLPSAQVSVIFEDVNFLSLFSGVEKCGKNFQTFKEAWEPHELKYVNKQLKWCNTIRHNQYHTNKLNTKNKNKLKTALKTQKTVTTLITTTNIKRTPMRSCRTQKWTFPFCSPITITITITTEIYIAPPTKWTGALNNKSYAYEWI